MKLSNHATIAILPLILPGIGLSWKANEPEQPSRRARRRHAWRRR